MKIAGVHLHLLLCAVTGVAVIAHGKTPSAETQCALRMRKVIEAAQAHRRYHSGAWPESLSQLQASGLLRAGEDCCPLMAQEIAAENPANLWTSRGEGRDAADTYQYELARINTWRELKLTLLGRNLWEQVPVLRCQRHGEGNFLNHTASGLVYTSFTFWECRFVADVPLPYRGPFLVSRRSVPPFATALPDRPDTLPAAAINLASWCNAFPADPWWWGNDLVSVDRPAATLAALVTEFPNGHATIENLSFDIRAVVQVGTCLAADGAQPARASGIPDRFTVPTFPSARIGLPLRQKAQRVVMLVGTVWKEQAGRAVGRFVWHFADGRQVTSTLEYGKDVDQFIGAAPPGLSGWSSSDCEPAVHLRLYRWQNPHPEIELASMDFFASEVSPASPFLVGMTLVP